MSRGAARAEQGRSSALKAGHMGSTNVTFKIAFCQHDVYNFGVQVREHLLHAFGDVLLDGAGERDAGWKVVRHGSVEQSRWLIPPVVAEASGLWRPVGNSGRALAVLLPPGHSVFGL
ncbi:hypothetical protein EYF80_020380 [Liparis tanakae]|uniref:Uncharacterized protein n=1 Tax=Liparis tanakae TaxID=230148 RepID=A0A4Z2HU88_9TELE|nr:hypothetical protein EYF80_020380 [Liparis tanakae]